LFENLLFAPTNYEVYAGFFGREPRWLIFPALLELIYPQTIMNVHAQIVGKVRI